MTSPDPITQIAGLRLEPTYSAREAALLLGRSYSWLDQRLHAGQFVRPDGTFVQPLRTLGLCLWMSPRRRFIRRPSARWPRLFDALRIRASSLPIRRVS